MAWAEPGRLCFRSMRADADGLPVLRDSTSGLGVRVPGDIAASDEFVYPGTGGMTVNFDSADNLSWHHRRGPSGDPATTRRG